MPLFDNLIHESAPAMSPISDEMLYKGFAAQEATTQKAQSDLREEYDNLFNVATASAGDAEVLQKAKQTLQDALKGVDISDLKNPQNQSKINSIISQVANNPDVLAVHQRGRTLEKMQAEKDKAEAQGKEYINPGWDDAISIINKDCILRTSSLQVMVG